MSATSKIIHTLATLGDSFSPTVMKSIIPSIKEWDAAIKQHNAEMAPFNALIRDAEKAIKPYTDAMMVIGGAVAGAGVALFALTDKYAQQGVQLDRMSEKYGVSVQWLSDTKLAADMSGVSMEALGTGMKRLNKTLEETLSGKNKDAAQYFKEMGISITDASGQLKSSDEIMMEVSDAFSKMADGAYKTTAAITIFGKTGDELIPMLDHGRQSFEQWAQVSKDLGLEWSGHDVQASQDFNQAIKLMEGEVSALGNGLAVELMPLFKQLPEIFVWVESKAIDLARGLNALTWAGSYLSEAFALIGHPTQYKSIEKDFEDFRQKSLQVSDALDKESLKLQKVEEDFVNLDKTTKAQGPELKHNKPGDDAAAKKAGKEKEAKEVEDYLPKLLHDLNVEVDAKEKIHERELQQATDYVNQILGIETRKDQKIKALYGAGLITEQQYMAAKKKLHQQDLDMMISEGTQAAGAVAEAMGAGVKAQALVKIPEAIWKEGEAIATLSTALMAQDYRTAALAGIAAVNWGAQIVSLSKAAGGGGGSSSGGGGGGSKASSSASAGVMASQSASSGAKTTIMLNMGKLAERGNMILNPAQWTQMTINEMAKAMSRDPKINVKTARGN